MTKEDLAREYCHCASCLDYNGCKNGDDSCSKFDGYLKGYTACEGELIGKVREWIKLNDFGSQFGDIVGVPELLAFLDELHSGDHK